MSDPEVIALPPEKRKPGRPKGSKNKIKVAADANGSGAAAAPAKKAAKKKAAAEKSTSAAITVDSDSDDEAAELLKLIEKIKGIEWTDDLVLQLIAKIKENDDARERLFPGPGTVRHSENGEVAQVIAPNTMSKKEATLLVIEDLFGAGDGPYHALYIATIKTETGKEQWFSKVKNKLSKMHDKFRTLAGQMGETGAGITTADAIDMTQKNALTDAWSNVRKAAPWFFEYKALVGARPNVIAEGHGNAAVPIDTNILSTRKHDDDTGSNATLSSDDDDDDGDGNAATKLESDDELPEISLASVEEKKAKRKRTDSQSESKDEKPRAAKQPATTKTKAKGAPKSTKSAPAVGGARAKVNNDRFTEIAKAEEETTRKRLDVKQSQGQHEHQYRMEKIRLSAQIKLEGEKQRRDLNYQKWATERRLEMEMRLHMMHMQQAGSGSGSGSVGMNTFGGGFGGFGNNMLGFGSIGGASYSDYGSGMSAASSSYGGDAFSSEPDVNGFDNSSLGDWDDNNNFTSGTGGP